MDKRQGFTILELLVVLAILGIVMSFVTVKMTASLDESRQTRIETDLSLLVGATEQYLQRHPDKSVTDQTTLVEAGVLKQVVESPLEGYFYRLQGRTGTVKVALMKGEAVYERGDYRAEKTSTRLYLD